MRECRLAEILTVLHGGVGDLIVGSTTGCVSPNVEEIEPMTDFMGRGRPRLNGGPTVPFVPKAL